MATNAVYFRVDTKFWAHARRARWSTDATTLALYLLTCKHRHTEGLYELPLGYAAADTGLTLDEVNQALDDLVDDGFVEYDPAADIVFLPKALAYQSPTAGDQVKGAVRRLEELPDSPLLARFAEVCAELCPDLWTALPDHWKTAPVQVPSPAQTPPVDVTSTTQSTSGRRDVNDPVDEVVSGTSTPQALSSSSNSSSSSSNRGGKSPPRGGDPTHIADLLPALPATAQPGAPPPPVPASTSAAPPAKARKQRPPDPVWDALVECFGPPTNDAERGKRNSAAKLLRQTLEAKDVPPDQHHNAVVQLRDAYLAGFTTPCTPHGVASNASTLIDQLQGRNQPLPRAPETAGYGVIG